MRTQGEGIPSHGRGRRFNPYNAHQNSLSNSVLSRASAEALDTQAYGTQPEHDASIRVKSVYGVRAPFTRKPVPTFAASRSGRARA